MAEWLQEWTPEQMTHALTSVSWRIAAIVGGSWVLVAWANAFKARWTK